jgi:hypothetical protein
MKSILHKLLVPVAAASLFVTVQKTEAQSVVEFGSLYGYSPDSFPTSIYNSNGSLLGESLEGLSLWFLCLERPATDPAEMPPQQWEYELSLSPDVLTSGIWAGIGAADRDSLLNGISNIFINNQAAIYGDTLSDGSSFNDPGSAVQRAAWALTDGYGSVWTGPLDLNAIDSIMAANVGYAGTLVENYLYSSLTAADGSGRVIFGTPAGGTPGSFQSVILFSPVPVPEPSALILIALTGVLVLGRARNRLL